MRRNAILHLSSPTLPERHKMASHQVGGHAASFFANPDPESTGSSLIKASCPTERDFYTILGPQLTRSYWNARRTSSEILGVTEDEVEARGRSGDDGFKEERGEAFIGVWTPAFFGVLTLNSAVAPSVEGTSGVNLATKPLAPPEVRPRRSFFVSTSLTAL